MEMISINCITDTETGRQKDDGMLYVHLNNMRPETNTIHQIFILKLCSLGNMIPDPKAQWLEQTTRYKSLSVSLHSRLQTPP